MGMSLLQSIRGRVEFVRLITPIAIGLAAFGVWVLPARSVHADVILIVDTAADVIANDGVCSLREAITAANNNGNYFNCIGSGGGYDLIEFSIGGGTPAINIGTPLPTITGPVEINGGPNRVELKGNGSFAGLFISGAGAAGSILRGLVLNGFTTSIHITSTTNIVIAGNFIGTNATGTVAAGGDVGIYLGSATAQIGGTNGLTANGPCTGDCNLISGNTAFNGSAGVSLQGSAGASVAKIEGNFIGTNAAGTAALGNRSGVRVADSFVTIGGTTASARNLISGNGTGISVLITENGAPGSIIQGNRIGTNVTGSGAIPNEDGINVYLDNRNYAVTIGGASPGAGNLISGNTRAGILLRGSDDVIIHGNRIGTQANGTSPLSNGTSGVELAFSTHENVIGGIGPGEGNIIAHNATGVKIGINDYHNRIRGNSISNNAGKGIFLADFQTNTAFAPVINALAPVSGTACPNCIVDVYADVEDEGGTFLGWASADGAGNWSFNGAVPALNITATATSPVGSTSEFSAVFSECIMKSGFEDGPESCN